MKEKIMKFLAAKPVLVVCRLILGGLFIYASIDKLTHPAAFAKIIYNYQLFPDFSVYISAVVVPWVELLSGLFLVAGIFTRASAGVLTALLLVFLVALTINLVRGLDFNCGCFTTGEGGRGDTLALVIRDLFLLIPGMIILFFYKEKGGEKVAQTA